MNGVETSLVSVDSNSLEHCTEIAVCAYNIVDEHVMIENFILGLSIILPLLVAKTSYDWNSPSRGLSKRLPAQTTITSDM